MNTSRMKATFNEFAFAKSYQIFHIKKYGGKGFSYADSVFDELCDRSNKVKGVYFTHEAGAWVLMERKAENGSNGEIIRSVFTSREYGASFCEYYVSNRKPWEDSHIAWSHIVLNLMLSSLSDPLLDEYEISNVGGALYVVSAAHFDYLKDMDVKLPDEIVPCIHALKVSVLPSMAIDLSVETFTSCGVREYNKNLARYTLIDGRHLRRAANVDNPNDPKYYVHRAPSQNSRYGGYNYLDATNLACFSHTKIGVLHDMLRLLMYCYGDILTLSFEEIPDERWHVKDVSASQAKKNLLRRVEKLLTGQRIAVSFLGDARQQKRDNLLRHLHNTLSASEIVERDAPEVGALNVVVLHDKGFYSRHELDDPYVKDERLVLQHVNIKTNFTRQVVETIVKELAIKKDLQDGAMMNVLPESIDGEWTFVSSATFHVRLVPHVEDENTKENEVQRVFPFYAAIHIKPNRTFICEGPFSKTREMNDDLEYLVDLIKQNGNAEYGFIDNEDNFNVVLRTQLFGMPDIDALVRDLNVKPTTMKGRKSNISKGREARGKYFKDSIGFSCAVIDDSLGGKGYYRVGHRGAGMHFDATHRASIIREVRAAPESALSVDKLIGFLDVDFIRLGEPAVVPYPIKYLREWFALQHLEERVFEALNREFPCGYEIERMTVTY